MGSTKQTTLAGLGHVTDCQWNAIWEMDEHISFYVFICPLVNSSSLFQNVLIWHILCMLKISIAVLCISFQQWETFKCGLNIFLVNFFLNFYFWNWWQLSDTQGWNFLLTLGLCVFVCVCVCVGLSENVHVEMYVHVPMLS